MHSTLAEVKFKAMKSLLVFIIVILAGCEQSNQNSEALNEVMRSVRQLQESVTGNIAPAAKDIQSAASTEVDKLFAIEYKVLELPFAVAGAEMEKQISALGADRWNCFSIIPRDQSIIVTCQRRPMSYLRYALRFFPVPIP